MAGRAALAIVGGSCWSCWPAAVTAAAAPIPRSAPEPGAIRVVATTTVLADLVAQVGGTRVNVDSLVPKGGEVHTFDPTPADVKRVAHADAGRAQRPRRSTTG